MKQMKAKSEKRSGNILDTNFRMSSFCNCGNCVEVARLDDGSVAVRDTKATNGGTLQFTQDEWVAFIKGVKNDEFDVA